MNPVVQQAVSWGVLALVSAAALTVIVVGWLGYQKFGRFVDAFGKLVEMMAVHGALTDKSARTLTQSILDAIQTSSPATASLVIKGLVDMGMKRIAEPLSEEAVPQPPAPPAKPSGTGSGERPAFNPKDSVRAITALAVSVLIAGGMAADFCPPRVCAMDGLTALRAGNVEAAKAKFQHDGNVLRVAECDILKGELDEAAALCGPVDSPASQRLQALIALERGDEAAAFTLFSNAASRGDVPSLAWIRSRSHE